ncbi:MAG: hypothetical protein AB8G18_14380 [Gammaproteobacteria bacterium]
MSETGYAGGHYWDTRPGNLRFTGAGLPSGFKSLVERPVLGLALYSAALLIVYLLIEQCVNATTAAPLSAYANAFLLPSVFAHFGGTARILGVLFAVTIALLDPARLRWQDFEGGHALRVGFSILALSMAWPFVTYGYNYAVDASHMIDRVLLLVSLILFVWRPAFVLVFLFLAYVLFAQLTAPSLGGSVIPHKTQVLRAIELFAAFHIVRIVTGYHRTGGLIFILGCYVAATYWFPAWAKFQLDWLSSNQLNMVPLAAYAHGWRGEQDPAQIVELANGLSGLTGVFQYCAFALEAAFALFVLRYRVALLLLCGAIGFHLGVFFIFGFFFWTWIVLDLVLIGLLIVANRRNLIHGIFGWKYLPLGMLLIIAGPYWAEPPVLAWYDTPLSYTYQVKATLDDGTEVRLNPRFFAPYEDAFTMVGFTYLVREHGVLVGPYGSSKSHANNIQLNDATSMEEVYALEAAQSLPTYDEKRAELFYEFVEQFVRNRNARGDVQQGLYALHSPRQFWSNSGGMSALGNRTIQSVTIVERSFFFDGNALKMTRELPLRTINLFDAQ